MGRPGPKPKAPDERFWPRVEKIPGGCWLWRGGKTGSGYGTFSVSSRKPVVAHRYAYETLVGPIPAGKVLDHQCHNRDATCPGGVCQHRTCVNPAHLEAVTQGENLANSPHTVNRASLMATHCPSGHPYDEHNTGRDGTDRTCKTCKREKTRANAPVINAARRKRYAELRAQGMSSKEARKASSRLAVSGGTGDCLEVVA